MGGENACRTGIIRAIYASEPQYIPRTTQAFIPAMGQSCFLSLVARLGTYSFGYREIAKAGLRTIVKIGQGPPKVWSSQKYSITSTFGRLVYSLLWSVRVFSRR